MIEQEIPDWSTLEVEEIWLTKDTGYQGYIPNGIILLEPFKAVRNHPLTDLKKQMNSYVSAIRVVVEHAIGEIKRLRLVSEKWRLGVEQRIDQAMCVAVGLHNLPIIQRKTSFAGAHARTGARLDIFRS
ncbi:MAG: transposase family protein [Bacteroidota bacterium]